MQSLTQVVQLQMYKYMDAPDLLCLETTILSNIEVKQHCYDHADKASIVYLVTCVIVQHRIYHITSLCLVTCVTVQ